MMPKMPHLKEGVTFVHKNITIRSDQDEFLKKTDKNLSRFVQRILDEEMNGNKAKK